MNTGEEEPTRSRPTRLWRLREPDAKDLGVLAALYEARLLSAPQLQRLYGFDSVGSLHPRLLGLLGPDGAPRVIERAKAPDGRYWYALGPEGYAYLPAGETPPARHKPLARLRLSAQFTSHAAAVGWLMITWLTGGVELPPDSARAWWGERRAMLPYPLRQPKGPVTHGRVEPDGVLVLTLPDGTRWCGALEHDQGTEDAADWAAKLGRWAAAIRAGAWESRFGATRPHLLVTVLDAARRMQIAPWLAAGRAKHGSFYIWIAEHPTVSLGEADSLDQAGARLGARVWQQVAGDARATPETALLPDLWALPRIIAATAPWRPDAPPERAPAPPTPRPARVLPPAEAEVHRLHGELHELRMYHDTLRHSHETLEGKYHALLREAGELRADVAALRPRLRQAEATVAALRAAGLRTRLLRYWHPPRSWQMAVRMLAAVGALLLLGAALTWLWVMGAQLWNWALAHDGAFAALVDAGAPNGTLVFYLWRTPWCSGVLVVAAVVGAGLWARWAWQTGPPPE